MSTRQFVDFKMIKDRITMEQILVHYGLFDRFKRSGENLSGPCPVHNGSNPTQFRVSLKKNCWNCFSGCNGGNVIDFVARKENVEFRQAAILISEWFSLNSKSPPSPPRRQEKVVVESSHSDPEINKPLGFVLKDLDFGHPYLASRGLEAETIREFGIGFFTGSRGLMIGRIAIPVQNEAGQMVAYAGRLVGDPPDPETGKYKFPPGFKKSLELFNVHRAAMADRDRPLVIVEGFFGCLRLWQAGIRRVVSVMGSNVSEPQEKQILKLISPEQKIVLAFDEDKAGREGREQALKRFAAKAYARVIEFPRENMQPDQLSKEEIDALAIREEPPEYLVKSPRFPLGKSVVTPNVIDSIPTEEVLAALHKHSCGDWGDVHEHDREANELALKDGSRLVSIYRSLAGTKFYIITEADRSLTTILLPEDY